MSVRIRGQKVEKSAAEVARKNGAAKSRATGVDHASAAAKKEEKNQEAPSGDERKNDLQTGKSEFDLRLK